MILNFKKFITIGWVYDNGYENKNVVQKTLFCSFYNFRDLAINQCLVALQEALTTVDGKSLCEYGLSTPTSVGEVTNREYSAEIGFNSMELLATLENGIPMMTAEQRSVYYHVCESVQNYLGTIWFLMHLEKLGKPF